MRTSSGRSAEAPAQPKTRKVELNALPKSVQPAAKSDLREVWAAPDRATAEAAVATFADTYGAKHDKAVACLIKDRDALLAFYDVPAEHWDHLRTSNPIESVFATVRHRTVRYPRRAVARHRPADGVQARHDRCEHRATAERRKPVAQARPGRHIPQRHRGHRHAKPERRLITASPKFRHSSWSAAARRWPSRCATPARGGAGPSCASGSRRVKARPRETKCLHKVSSRRNTGMDGVRRSVDPGLASPVGVEDIRSAMLGERRLDRIRSRCHDRSSTLGNVVGQFTSKPGHARHEAGQGNAVMAEDATTSSIACEVRCHLR